MSTGADELYGKENYRSMKQLLKKRVGQHRYQHSKGVAKSARRLAGLYGYDPDKARMAGILHDWDKGLSADEVRKRADDLKVDVSPVVARDMPWLLHGPTAAAALAREYPEFDDAIFQAIARHTSGAVDMSPLDCIVYVADIIEPNRVFGDKDAITELRKMVGKVPLEELYFHAFKYTLQFLISMDRQLYPGTLDIWNAMMWKYGTVRKFK